MRKRMTGNGLCLGISLLLAICMVAPVAVTSGRYTDSSYRRTVTAVIPGQPKHSDPVPAPEDGPSAELAGETLYQVKAGDTLAGIAEHYQRGQRISAGIAGKQLSRIANI